MYQIKARLDNLKEPKERYEFMLKISELYGKEKEFLGKFNNSK